MSILWAANFAKHGVEDLHKLWHIVTNTTGPIANNTRGATISDKDASQLTSTFTALTFLAFFRGI
jgi:hypothetical protein